MCHMQQNICSPVKDVKTFTFTDSTAECWCTTEQVLLQTAITLLRLPDFEKNRFFEDVLQSRLCFKH